MLEFELGDSDHVFGHEWQAVGDAAVPKILGNDFWSAHEANFDFGKRVIRLTVGSRQVSVPFTVGDEHDTERGRVLCSMVDMVVPPRTPYLLPTLPHDSCGKPARLSHMRCGTFRLSQRRRRRCSLPSCKALRSSCTDGGSNGRCRHQQHVNLEWWGSKRSSQQGC